MHNVLVPCESQVVVNSCMGCNDDLTGVGRAGKANNRLTVQKKRPFAFSLVSKVIINMYLS